MFRTRSRIYSLVELCFVLRNFSLTRVVSEKPELVPQGTGIARAESMQHNQLCCSQLGYSLCEAWHYTAAGHHLRQLQSPTGTCKLTREVSAEVGMNPVALTQDQTAKFALLLSKEALRGAAHLVSAGWVAGLGKEQKVFLEK